LYKFYQKLADPYGELQPVEEETEELQLPENEI
jgi:hypothetical protein